jgi:hypothetical protein
VAAIEERTHDPIQEESPLVPETEIDADIGSLVQNISASSIAEIEHLMGKLEEARTFLQSEGERIQREAAHYTSLTQMATASVKIIFDTVHEWRQAGHPLRDRSRPSSFEITSAQAEDGTGQTAIQDEKSSPLSGQAQP